MTLNIYADVDPDAKRAAVSSVEESFDSDLIGYSSLPENPFDAKPASPPSIAFTAEQLRAMLAQLEQNEGQAS